MAVWEGTLEESIEKNLKRSMDDSLDVKEQKIAYDMAIEGINQTKGLEGIYSERYLSEQKLENDAKIRAEETENKKKEFWKNILSSCLVGIMVPCVVEGVKSHFTNKRMNVVLKWNETEIAEGFQKDYIANAIRNR